MEKENDVQLIQDTLSGDEAAFSTLVQKYQRNVHALVWRKTGDFHYAEEITQDTFLQAYEKLSTLRNPNQFAGWLYVIANRRCINWLRRQKPTMRSLEETSVKEIDKLTYERHILEQREADASEHRYDIVKKLLEKLPESERTVVTLHYLGEMTIREISKFLGVSNNTIRSRLRRGRERLRENQESLIQEVLGGVQIPARISQNIMRQVADLNPIQPPSATKHLLPWGAFGAAAVLTLLLMLGISKQYLLRFQEPYSFEAQSQPTIEIIDVPIILDIDSKPAIRNQTGRATSNDNGGNAGSRISDDISTSDAQVDASQFSTAQWTRTTGPQGSPTYDIFEASSGTLYVSTQTGVYRLPTDLPAWTPINTYIHTPGGKMAMAEHNGTLYIVSTDEILASTDNGETWNVFCPKPEGYATGLIVTDRTQATDSQADITMYLALKHKGKDKGIFRSTDAGAHWNLLSDGMAGERIYPIYPIAAIGNTVFAGTNEGLYRLNGEVWEEVRIDVFKTAHSSENEAFADTDTGLYRLNAGVWEQVPVGAFDAVYALETFENNLYVAMGPDLFMWRTPETTQGVIVDTKTVHGRIFHSTDLGESWTEITPKNELLFFTLRDPVQFLVAGETLLARGIERFRSTDVGETWTKLATDPNLSLFGTWKNLGVNERTFYTVGIYGIHRTTDAGDSWHLFSDGIIGTRTQELVTFNDRFYLYTNRNFVQSTDGGESWKSVRINAESLDKAQTGVRLSPDADLAVADGDLYGLTTEKENLYIFRLSMDANAFIPVQGMPTLDYKTLPIELRTILLEMKLKLKGIYWLDNIANDSKLTTGLRHIETSANTGGFTVSDGTFYVEYQRGLFKWTPGDSEWTHTGLIDTDTTPVINRYYDSGFKLAASAETVYVGMRDGKLFQSFDAGNSWKNITLTLPLHFESFKEIVFAGSTIYVATDKGVLASQNGEHWRVLTDRAGERTLIDRLAVDHVSVYGAGNTGIYRLDARGKWEQILPNVPSKIVALVINNNKLYISTERIGMFHVSLEDKY
ncbi:MAG: sigma-70 family RNA polymerase sigma factor [Candidatus Poribacteria bacterium]|nr:sigma-70 family RNA polymerase sigma factor [Candidatus Poribacteria bacterium]